MSPATSKKTATSLSDTETRADNPIKKRLHYWPRFGVDQTVIVLPVFDVADSPPGGTTFYPKFSRWSKTELWQVVDVEPKPVFEKFYNG